MKLRIKREELLKPLQRVIGAVERRQTLPALGNVLFVASEDGTVTLTATDLELELVSNISADVAVAGETTVPARKLLDIARTLPESADLDIELKESKALIKAARSRFTLATLPATEFPALDEIESGFSFEIEPPVLREALEKTAFSMAQQDVRYYLNGLLLELRDGMLRTVATDGHRLAIAETEHSVDGGEDTQVIVPRKGVQEILRLLDGEGDKVGVQLTSNHIRITLPSLRFTSKLIDGRFPDYQRVMPQGGDKFMFADREELKLALQRASILSNEKYKGIRLMLSKDELRIQTHNPDQEEAEEELPVEYDGEALEIGFNVTYLAEILGVIDGERVQLTFKDANSSCLLEDTENGSNHYIVMPMRL